MASKLITGSGLQWYQTILTCPAKSRGVHKITDFVVSSMLFLFLHLNSLST